MSVELKNWKELCKEKDDRIKELEGEFDLIVERLEEEKGIAFLTLANTGNKVKDIVYGEVMAYLNTAIEIVKEVGGMND